MSWTSYERLETPMDPNIKLEACGEGIPMDREKFQQLVGKLIYLTHTRLDISFVVSKISQFPKQSFGRTHGSHVSDPKVSPKGSQKGTFVQKNTLH